MSTFFIWNGNKPTDLEISYPNYILFYKKSKEATIATIQDNLFSKLIEQALKLNKNQFLWVNVAAENTRFSTILKNNPVQKCFLFGVTEKEVGLNMTLPLYQLQKLKDIEFLKVDAPETLEQDKLLKSKLWSQLVISFKISV